MAVKKSRSGAVKSKPRTGRTAAAKKTGKAKTRASMASPAPGIARKITSRINSNSAMLKNLIHDISALLEAFMDTAGINSNLSSKERDRLIGAGVRNYGFIEKTLDIARDNPSFLPPNFDVQKFADDLQEFDQLRQFYFLSEKLQTLGADSILLKSDVLFRESLRVYNTLREQSRSGVPGAKDLFAALSIYFRRRRVSERPPTEAQELRKARSLIMGKSDGEMIIENIKPKVTAGIHKVIDKKLTNSERFKETLEGNVQD